VIAASQPGSAIVQSSSAPTLSDTRLSPSADRPSPSHPWPAFEISPGGGRRWSGRLHGCHPQQRRGAQRSPCCLKPLAAIGKVLLSGGGRAANVNPWLWESRERLCHTPGAARPCAEAFQCFARRRQTLAWLPAAAWNWWKQRWALFSAQQTVPSSVVRVAGATRRRRRGSRLRGAALQGASPWSKGDLSCNALAAHSQEAAPQGPACAAAACWRPSGAPQRRGTGNQLGHGGGGSGAFAVHPGADANP